MKRNPESHRLVGWKRRENINIMRSNDNSAHTCGICSHIHNRISSASNGGWLLLRQARWWWWQRGGRMVASIPWWSHCNGIYTHYMHLFLLMNESQKKVLQDPFAQVNCPKNMIYINVKTQVSQTERNPHLICSLGLYWLAAYSLEEDQACLHKALH